MSKSYTFYRPEDQWSFGCGRMKQRTSTNWQACVFIMCVFGSTWLATCRHTHTQAHTHNRPKVSRHKAVMHEYTVCFHFPVFCHMFGSAGDLFVCCKWVSTCLGYQCRSIHLYCVQASTIGFNTSRHTYNVKTSFPDFHFRATFNMLLWNHSPQVCKLFIKAVAIRGEKSIAPRKENRLLPHLSQKAVC